MPSSSHQAWRAPLRWTCNMTMYYKPAEPGVMLETGFGQEYLALASCATGIGAFD